jgi:hypothetical protein
MPDTPQSTVGSLRESTVAGVVTEHTLMHEFAAFFVVAIPIRVVEERTASLPLKEIWGTESRHELGDVIGIPFL